MNSRFGLCSKIIERTGVKWVLRVLYAAIFKITAKGLCPLPLSFYVRMNKKLFIKTWGCQMNEYDSEKMADLLDSTHGFSLAEDAVDHTLATPAHLQS